VVLDRSHLVSGRLDALDRAELAALWTAMRAHLERRSLRVDGARVTLTELTEDEMAAVCSLLGRRRPASARLRVDVEQLDAVLRAGPFGVGVAEVLETIGGPLRDRRGERASAAEARDSLWELVDEHPIAGDADVANWIESLRPRGRLTRLGLTAADRTVTTALDVVAALVERRRAAPPSRPLPVVAAELLGDAHGLDDDRVVGQIVADAVVSLSERSSVREAWAAFGVDLDPVNSSVLTLGLPGPRGTILDIAHRTGEPLRLTSRMLRSLDLDHLDGVVVSVCENPAVVAVAADELGPSCAPLVCTDGMPKTVTSSLIGTLVAAGATLRAHADFDVGGVAIVGHLIGVHGVEPWRFGREDYLAAVAGPSLALDGRIAATPWDPELAPTMGATGRAVHEESLLDVLLDDLA
jgi:uncharacterized protein (TIGR02679 family)